MVTFTVLSCLWLTECYQQKKPTPPYTITRKGKNEYCMYELFDFCDGIDDILSDIGGVMI
jgi:hypothetical protein